MKIGRAAREIKLSGVFAAAVTPNRIGSRDADYTGLMDLLDFLANAGVDGICILGSTGEFLNYPFSDRQRLVYLGVKRSRVPLLVGVGHSTLRGALELASEAIAAGADGLLIMPPYFFRYDQPEIERFYLEFARETGDAVPILLYNIPQFTSPIAPSTARALLDTGRFAGMKDSSGDRSYFQELLALRGQHPFALLAGSDRLASQALASGADGVVSGCASAIPELLVALYRTHKAQNAERTEALQSTLNDFIDWIERFPTPVGVKCAVELRGQKAGEFATPLSAPSETALGEFAGWFKEWWPAIARSLK